MIETSAPRLTTLALCFHQHTDLFTAQVVSVDPEAVWVMPQLGSTSGMPFGPLTADDLHEILQIDPDAIAAARSNPGVWYSLTQRRYLAPDEAPAAE